MSSALLQGDPKGRLRVLQLINSKQTPKGLAKSPSIPSTSPSEAQAQASLSHLFHARNVSDSTASAPASVLSSSSPVSTFGVSSSSMQRESSSVSLVAMEASAASDREESQNSTSSSFCQPPQSPQTEQPRAPQSPQAEQARAPPSLQTEESGEKPHSLQCQVMFEGTVVMSRSLKSTLFVFK